VHTADVGGQVPRAVAMVLAVELETDRAVERGRLLRVAAEQDKRCDLGHDVVLSRPA